MGKQLSYLACLGPLNLLVLVYAFVLKEVDLPRPFPVGQGSFKSYLPSKKIVLVLDYQMGVLSNPEICDVFGFLIIVVVIIESFVYVNQTMLCILLRAIVDKKNLICCPAETH